MLVFSVLVFWELSLGAFVEMCIIFVQFLLSQISMSVRETRNPVNRFVLTLSVDTLAVVSLALQ